MKPTSSRAKTLVGSPMASVSVLPWSLTGRTSYLRAICSGTSLRTSGSMSSWESVIDWIPYWRDRKAIRFSSVTKLSLTSMLPSLSLEPFCSCRARASCSLSINPSRTRRSPRRRLTGWGGPGLGSAIVESAAGLLVGAGHALEGVAEGLESLVLIEDEGDRGHLVLLRDGQRRTCRRHDLVGIGLEVEPHGGRVDHVGGGQVAGHGKHGLSRLDGSLPHGFFFDDGAAFSLHRPRHARAHPQLGVGGIDDGVDLGLRDIAPVYRDCGAADLDLHDPSPPPRGVSRALAASHARSSCSGDISSSFRPSAVIVASTSLNRRVNVSAACLSESSASMSSRRATLTRENRRSPSSARIRVASPWLMASSASATSSRTLAHAWVQLGQSNPTRPALTCNRWARDSAGRLCGTPSSAERDVPSSLPSARLIRSHWLRASRASATSAVPKTWGWRWVILSKTFCKTSAMVNSPRSWAIWQWKTTWKSTSPSSSTMWSGLPSSIAWRVS